PVATARTRRDTCRRADGTRPAGSAERWRRGAVPLGGVVGARANSSWLGSVGDRRAVFPRRGGQLVVELPRWRGGLMVNLPRWRGGSAGLPRGATPPAAYG